MDGGPGQNRGAGRPEPDRDSPRTVSDVHVPNVRRQGTIFFSPPEILAGELPNPTENLKLNLKKLAFICQGPCAKSVTQRFEIKMLSREQLRVLFGRTLAYTIKTKCGATTKVVMVRVSINQNGKLRRLPREGRGRRGRGRCGGPSLSACVD